MKFNSDMKYELVKKISNKIRDTLDLDLILNHLLDTLNDVIHYDAAGIFILNDDLEQTQYYLPKQLIAAVASRGFDDHPPEKDEMLSGGMGIVGYVIKSGKSIIIPDVSKNPDYIQGRKLTRSEITVPIIRNEKVIGALDVESDNINFFSKEDIEVLNHFADAASISIDKAILHLQILEKEKIKKQLLIAKEVQSGLLPENPPDIIGYDFAGISIPTYEIGGDYFDYIPLGQDRFGIAVADVSGHGVPAALIMTAFRTLLRTHAKAYKNISELMNLLNRELYDFTRKKDFVTVFYGILDPAKNIFEYINCGHNIPFLIKSEGSIERLKKGGPSLRIIQDTFFEYETLNLNSGDKLIIYTDGVIELFDEKLESFGEEKLLTLCQNSSAETAEELIEEILESTKNYCGSQGFRDDFTLVIIRRI